jgi:hypothetical protein
MKELLGSQQTSASKESFALEMEINSKAKVISFPIR